MKHDLKSVLSNDEDYPEINIRIKKDGPNIRVVYDDGNGNFITEDDALTLTYPDDFEATKTTSVTTTVQLIDPQDLPMDRSYEYGFPKTFPDGITTDAAIKKWLVDNGYPQEWVDEEGFFWKIWDEQKTSYTIEVLDDSALPAKADVLASIETQNTVTEPYKLLREDRDKKLVESDWTGNSDVTMSSGMKTYRQKLRDLPDTESPELDADGNLTAVTWPTKP
jgi:hypothetical protein